MAAHAAGVPRDLTTGVYALRILKWQRDGHWTTSDFRPPHSSSAVTATATAVRAIRLYLPDELAVERERALGEAREWLSAIRPISTEDAAFRVMGLVWSEGSPDEITSAARELRARQTGAGGWSQLPGYEADAYSTGEALVALREAGVEAGDTAWQRGAEFLRKSQGRDGTWRVRTRMLSPAKVSPPYFKTGFPYGKDEFLSYAGSCWAVMALLSELPSASSSPSPASSAQAVPTWMRTALFGSADALRALLDGSLDPRSRTTGGTTLLMAAAHDSAKAALLIARGADVKVRTPSGTDALTVAAAYRGTAGSLRLLLDAGADVDPPEGVHLRRSPLVLAAMAGDGANVALLLARGARADEEALSEAVTFGHADIVRALIRAGARARITEPSGVNLLHWATITNRAPVVPILAEAGVPLNDTDDAGFTPLMYAATVDMGETAVAQALLAAGADRRVRNPAGRTPLAQARHYGHRQLAEILR